MPTHRLLATAAEVAEGLDAIAQSVLERDRADDLVLVGIRRGGEPVAREIGRLLGARTGRIMQLGSVDITLYRDDAATALASPRIGPSHIPFEVTSARVLLVDDVLYTGRTIRAALDALLDYGRPRRIELAVIADRLGRELPVQADYRVLQTDVPAGSRVEVEGEANALTVVQRDSPPGGGT